MNPETKRPESPERPEFMTDEMLSWLDNLRQGGTINMLAAPTPLAKEFRLTTHEARQVWIQWATTFGEQESEESE